MRRSLQPQSETSAPNTHLTSFRLTLKGVWGPVRHTPVHRRTVRRRAGSRLVPHTPLRQDRPPPAPHCTEQPRGQPAVSGAFCRTHGCQATGPPTPLHCPTRRRPCRNRPRPGCPGRVVQRMVGYWPEKRAAQLVVVAEGSICCVHRVTEAGRRQLRRCCREAPT